MRILIPTLCLVSCVLVGCGGGDAQRAETIDAADGQKIQKQFYADGTIKTITRLYPDGRTLGTLYHTTNGVPTHADYYDDSKRTRRTLLYRPDGTAHTSQEFDEQHILTMETSLDGIGEATAVTFFLQARRIILRSSPTWKIIAHELNGSRDVIVFQIPNPADERTPDSANVSAVAYDLSQSTNMTAFADRKKTSENRTPKPEDLKGWTIYKFQDKQGETPYEVHDAFRNFGEQYGLHVRLAFPNLPGTTQEWTQTLQADFIKLLETTEKRDKK